MLLVFFPHIWNLNPLGLVNRNLFKQTIKKKFPSETDMLPALRIMDTEHQKIVQPENKPSRKTMFYSLEDAEVKGAKEQFFFFFCHLIDV